MRVVLMAMIGLVLCAPRLVAHGFGEDDEPHLSAVWFDHELMSADEVLFYSGYRMESADRLASRVARSVGRGSYRALVEIKYESGTVTPDQLRRCQDVLNLHLDRRLGNLRGRVLVRWKQD
jgi:hypothetical protein